MDILLTLLIASFGAFIAIKIKLPAGALLGAFITVSIYNIVTENAFMPEEIQTFTQLISGVFIGATIERSDVLQIRKSLKPAVLTIFLLFIACIIMGITLFLFTKYSLATTLFATAPGGLLNTTLMSMEMNANTSVVSVLQITRLVTVISLFPLLLNLLITKFIFRKNKRKLSNSSENLIKIDEEVPPEKSVNKRDYLSKMSLTILVGLIFGFLGYLSGIPAGTLMFTMIGSAILNITWNKAYVPKPMKTVAQVFGGALIGTNIDMQAVIEMKHLVIPALLMMFGFFIINILLAYILYKRCNMDMITALFSTTPGGATTISLMADDFGAKPSIVSTLQILRSISVIILYPFIIEFIYALII